MKKLFVLGPIIGIALFAGCASVPMATPAMDAEAKTFKPEPGKASIYINRKGSLAGGALIIQTVLDGRIAGGLAPRTFQFLSVSPGEHVIMTSGQFENSVKIKLNTLQGENYFFDIGPSMGMFLPHVNLKQIGAEEGTNDVIASKRADADVY